MRIALEGLTEWVRSHYDRLIALAILLVLLVSLLVLGVRVGMKKTEQERYRREVESWQALHPDATPVDRTVFQRGTELLQAPETIPDWDNYVMVPEMRVSCVYCGEPILPETKVCGECGHKQPEEIIREDKDEDGIKDEWEVKYNLNPLDPGDADRDTDRDGFTNLEEYREDTDPTDAGDFPPPVRKIRVVTIVPLPFDIMFKGVNTMPGGKILYQLNFGRKQTYWKEMGEQVEGFTLADYEKREREETDGVRKIVDESVLTLKSGKREIRLIKNELVPYHEYKLTLEFTGDGTTVETRMDEEFEIRGQRYQAKDVDSPAQRVLIEDLSTGEETWIGERTLMSGASATEDAAPREPVRGGGIEER